MKKQVFATIAVNILTLIDGISNGAIAPNIVDFQKADSPISQITPKEAAVIVSILCVGGILGTLIFGNVADILGRKWTLIFLAFPQLIANGLLVIGTNSVYVCAARILLGLSGGGVFTVIPMFVSEVTQERIRGAMGTLFSFTWNLGVLIGYALASWVDYFKEPFVSMALGLLFLVIFVWFPESPDYLHYKGLKECADKAYDFYGNHRTDNAEVKKEEKASWADFKPKAVRRGFIISMMLIFFTDTCGIYTITNYITELLNLAEIDLDIYLITIVMGFIQILGCAISSFSMDRFGRRFLFITSAAISSLALFVFGLFYNLKRRDDFSSFPKGLQWMAIGALAVYILGTSLAISGGPFMVMAEMVPTKVRARAMTIFLSSSWATAFGLNYLFYPMVGWLGVDGTYWVYASVCAVEVVYVYFCMPETKNLSIEAIQRKLEGKKE